jgi:hypothetical protein
MPQQQQQGEWSNRDSFNVLYVVANAYATAITPFVRHSFGKEALGLPGFLAFILILLVAGFTGSSSMLTYLGVWLIAVAFQRLHTYRLSSRGVVLHSRYEGWPWLGFKLGGGRNLDKRLTGAVFVIEPVLCFGIGGMFMSLGEVIVGRFLMCGAGALLFREAVHRMIDQRRVQAMCDAQIEQEYLANEYRRRR